METSRVRDDAGSAAPALIAVMTAVFVGMKTAGYIDWSWWAVTAPVWGSFLLIILFAVLLTVVAFLLTIRDDRRARVGRRRA